MGRSHMREMTKEYKIFVGKPERKRPLGRPRHIWEDDIKICPGEIAYKFVDYIHLAQDRHQ